MYNRYVPQPDGSFYRNRISDPPKPPPDIHTTTKQQVESKQQRKYDSITGFFKNLLPNNMDTGDLIIVLLLLLLANDCEQDRNHALLTLALYFFL